MKIVHVIPNLYTAGAEKVCIDLCNEMASDSKHEVILCSLFDVNDKMPLVQTLSPKVKLITLNKKLGLDVYAFYKLYKILSREKPDIVNTHLAGLMYSSISVLFSKIKFLHTVHTLAHKETGSLQRILYSKLFNYFGVIPIAISEEVAKSIKKEYGISTVVIMNGTQMSKTTNKLNYVKDELSLYKKNAHTKIFVNIGRIATVKNQEMLVKVFSNLYQDGKNVALLIIGEYSSKEKLLYNRLNSIKSINTYFLGLKDNIGDYLYLADAFVLSSLWEGLPITLLESMSMGKISICTPVGGIPDVIRNGYNGFLSDDLTDHSFYNAIIKFLELDNNTIRDIETNAQKCFNKKYNISKTSRKYIEYYNK